MLSDEVEYKHFSVGIKVKSYYKRKTLISVDYLKIYTPERKESKSGKFLTKETEIKVSQDTRE